MSPSTELGETTPTSPPTHPDELTARLAEAAAALGRLQAHAPAPTEPAEPAEPAAAGRTGGADVTSPSAAGTAPAEPADLNAADPDAADPATPDPDATRAVTAPRTETTPPSSCRTDETDRTSMDQTSTPAPAALEPAALRAGASLPVPRGPRRARLVLRRVETVSVLKAAFVCSLATALILLVAACTLFVALSGLGVLEAVNTLLAQLLRSAGPAAVDPTPLITGSRVLRGAAGLGALLVILSTVMAGLASVIYNIAAAFTGGVRVVLADDHAEE